MRWRHSTCRRSGDLREAAANLFSFMAEARSFGARSALRWSRSRTRGWAKRSTTGSQGPPRRVTAAWVNPRLTPMEPILSRFAAIVGANNALSDPSDVVPYLARARATSSTAALRWC